MKPLISIPSGPPRIPIGLLLLALVSGSLALAQPGLSEPPSLPEPAELPGATPAASTPAASTPAILREGIVREGIRIDLTVESLEEGKTEFQEGDFVRVRFEVKDTAGGQGISSLYPAAWMDRLPDGSPWEAQGKHQECKQKVQNFIGGTLLHQPDLDMNVYYVLALNEDSTISVVDPLFGFGGSKLLSMVFLKSPGEDWALAGNQGRLFVSMPDSDQVAVVETSSWEVLLDVDVAATPERLLLQPDQQYLWVAYSGADPASGVSGVSVVDTHRLREVERIATGRGRHQMAIREDDRYLFVTNEQDGTLSVIDIPTLEKIKDVPIGTRATALAYSAGARAVYVTDREQGALVVVDAERLEVVRRIQVEPGVEGVYMAPGGRLGFVVNPQKDTVQILDLATNRIVQTASVEKEPDQIAFSDELAYVRHRGSETVLMIPLGEVGIEGQRVPVVDFPAGQHPPGRSSHPSPAPGIVQAPGASAILVSNPLDEAIYYYKEGMAAPMGNFTNYGHRPRAVQVIDRSLQETAPGVYETAVRLRRPGHYDLAFFLDVPRVVHCFGMQVAENPVLVLQRRQQGLKIEPLIENRELRVGEPTVLRFRILDPVTGEPKNDLQDVNVLTFLAPGTRQQRQWADATGDGIYEVSFAPPAIGVYYLFLEVASEGLKFNQSPSVVLEAMEAVPPKTGRP